MEPTAAELSEVSSWGAREKSLFLSGFQWLAAMTSQKLGVLGGGGEYHGLVPSAIKAILDVLSAAEPVLSKLPPSTLAGQAELGAAAQNAAETSGAIEEMIRRYRPLRDKTVRDLVAAGASIEFEYFGDSPTKPGLLMVHREVEQGVTPEVSAVYSTMTPPELVQSGISLQEQYDEVMRGAKSNFPILSTLSALTTNILAFFAAYDRIQDEKNFNGEVLSAIENDTTLTPAQKADGINKIKNAEVLLGNIFSKPFPWTTVIVAGAAVGALVLLAPSILGGTD